MNCILPRIARKTDFGTSRLFSCLWMTGANELICFLVWPLQRQQWELPCKTASWVPYHIHTTCCDYSPLCGVTVVHPVQYVMYSITIPVTRKKKKKRYHGCLAHTRATIEERHVFSEVSSNWHPKTSPKNRFGEKLKTATG